MTNPTHNDTRSPHTDALETIGMIHFKKEARDAVHFAVEPVVAGMNLEVGQRIGIIEGTAYATGSTVYTVGGEVKAPYHGIVDPFLPRGPNMMESFWFIMAPRVVRSLRHVWEAPGFPKGV